MNRYHYDLHMHSCLSPCGDNDSTPNSIAGMCALSGIEIAALTDHNTSRNCPAFFKACKRYGVIPVAGMELTTAEDIHVVCLFETLDAALAFNDEVDIHRMRVPNRKEIFGDQLITDDEDNVIGEEPDLLINATDITIDGAPALVEQFGGVCYPAHIDREANGIIATLGVFPELPYFGCVEVHDMENMEKLRETYPVLNDKLVLECSDAHYLTQIRDAKAYFDLDDEPYSGDNVRKELFKVLRRL